jgi:hypothetical protein
MTESRLAIVVSVLAFLAVAYQGWIGRETLHDAERAYVFPDFTKTRTHAAVGDHLGVIVAVRNAGHTPAYQLRYWMIAEIYDGPPFPKGDALRTGTPTYAVIQYPEVDIDQPLFAGGALTQADLNSFEATEFNVGGAAREIYVWGRIDYMTFNETAHTRFCYSATHDENLPPDAQWMWVPCEGGNDSD